MINVTVFGEIAEIKIGGSPEEFSRLLEWVKDVFAIEDRQFLDFKKVWVIKNLKKYENVPEIADALKRAEAQPALF